MDPLREYRNYMDNKVIKGQQIKTKEHHLQGHVPQNDVLSVGVPK